MWRRSRRRTRQSVVVVIELSVVTTMFRSAPYLLEFHRRVSGEAAKLTDDYEILFVNDGSPDESLAIALTLRETDSHVKVVDLSRNFGHHKAMMTGLRHAAGKRIFLIDCDLEEEPELLGRFDAVLAANPQADVVYGVQSARKGAWFERISGKLHYAILHALWDLQLPENVVVARLMTRRYVDNLIAHPESELVISGLWLSTGFTQLPVPIVKHDKGSSTYDLRRKSALMIRSITAFSDKPLVYIAYFGFAISALSVIYTVYLISRFLFFGRAPEGYTSLIVSVWLLGGMIIFSVGIVAIYLSVMFVEIKRRPLTVVREVYERENRDG